MIRQNHFVQTRQIFKTNLMFALCFININNTFSNKVVSMNSRNNPNRHSVEDFYSLWYERTCSTHTPVPLRGERGNLYMKLGPEN